MPGNRQIWGNHVSETRSPLVVVHPRTGDPSPLQANTARAGRARISQAKRGGSTGPPDRSRHVTCGNDESGEPGTGPHAGPDHGSRSTTLEHQGSTVTAARCCSPVPAPQPQPGKPGPDDLATELNPHKTELNPHKAAEAASRARTDQPGLPSSGRSPPARQLAKAALSRRPRSAMPMTLRYRHGPSLRTRSRRMSPADGGYLYGTARATSGADWCPACRCAGIRLRLGGGPGFLRWRRLTLGSGGHAPWLTAAGCFPVLTVSRRLS